jgi:hypothetical protein
MASAELSLYFYQCRSLCSPRRGGDGQSRLSAATIYLAVLRKAGDLLVRSAKFKQTRPKSRLMRALDRYDRALLAILQVDALRTAEELAEVQVLTEIAGQMDLALVIAARDMDAFNDFVDEALASEPLVRRYETRLVKRRRKFTTAWPIPQD